MKIGIVGGGPGGLYFALLMKKHNLAQEIRILEQNPAGNTYGWGVVFSGRALSYVGETDSDSYDDIAARLETWDDLAIVHRGERIAIGGNAFSAIARIDLLRVLQEHCLRVGVEIQFETPVTDLEPFADCDLIVGADGANSGVRQKYNQCFQTSLDVRSNKYVWYGTEQLFDGITLTFRENEDGAFVAHSYRHNKTTSTVVVECDAPTWDKAGFSSMSDAESRAYCEAVFQDDLGGHPLLSNKSVWLNYIVVNNRRWRHENIVLIGDALHTVHFSIGSGTRMALQDAIALYKAFETQGEDVEKALEEFENTGKPIADQLLNAAYNSLTWYEDIRNNMHLDPIPFAYDYMMRNRRLDHGGLKKRDPEFAAAYEAYLASRE